MQPPSAPVLTEAHCIAAKDIVNLSFDHIYHRDTGLLDYNKFAPIEVACALIYCDQRTCAGRHKDCDCKYCLSVQVEAVADCFECRKYHWLKKLLPISTCPCTRMVEIGKATVTLF